MAVDGEGNLYGENFRVSKSKQTSVGLLTQQTQLNELNDELPKLIADVEQAQAQKEALQTRLKAAQQAVDNNSANIHQIAQGMAKAQTHSELLEKQHANWQQTLEQYQQKQGSLKAQLTEQAAPIAKQKQQIADMVAALELLQAQQIELQTQADEQEQAYIQAASHSQTAQQALHQAELELQKVQNTWQLEQTKQQHSQSVLNSALERLETLQQQLEDQQLPLLECEEQLMVLVEQHQEIEIQLEQCQTQKAQAQKALQDKQASLQDAQSGVTKKQNQLQQLKLAEQELMIKAQLMLEPLEELQQTLKDILASLPENPKLVSFQSKLQNTTAQLLDLGAVNLAAIEEYDQALERKTYLDEQLDDLTAALETLEGAIRKIDRETKQRFKQTFDQVNKDFGGLFPKVFGGGQAYLELTSDDLLETGVAIMARPPGKKNSTIHLLSGGEKALTALSLVFSIFRLNPAPFCMLDEVDAPLDDANVVRFCRLVEEMSQSVQFIYISHNKIAMEMAGRLTGVTMAEPGVSRMVAVDIEQAVQMAQT
jgi:chromosome segregation protein